MEAVWTPAAITDMVLRLGVPTLALILGAWVMVHFLDALRAKWGKKD